MPRQITSNDGEVAIVEGETSKNPDQGPVRILRRELTREEFLESFPVGEVYQ
jgi:hypothetical protein